MNTPQELTQAEWKELMQLPAVKDAWGIEDGETPGDFAQLVYGVRFDFVSGIAPGYVGDLYILHGDSLGEPMVLIRRDGRLVVA